MTTNKKKKKEDKQKGFPIPVGTEQETGLTRAETEKPKDPQNPDTNTGQNTGERNK